MLRHCRESGGEEQLRIAGNLALHFKNKKGCPEGQPFDFSG